MTEVPQKEAPRATQARTLPDRGERYRERKAIGHGKTRANPQSHGCRNGPNDTDAEDRPGREAKSGLCGQMSRPSRRFQVSMTCCERGSLCLLGCGSGTCAVRPVAGWITRYCGLLGSDPMRSNVSSSVLTMHPHSSAAAMYSAGVNRHATLSSCNMGIAA